ncbi:MAG: DUF2851 family protein [Bacteroidales bacterium]|nr:DUF2851 family protein [Bacteroidales bacterium]MDD4086980.1 DUF2851 family protein [Bacteroidales bacterium]
MNEFFIHYLWENKLLKPGLQTTEKEPIQILHPGTRNADAGPDFLNARIKIGETTWAGNVEIHTLASDWYKHHHDQDKAYENVILHVVYSDDKTVYDSQRKPLQTLEIKDKYPSEVLLKYRKFVDSKQWIACENQVHDVQWFTWLSWLDRMIAERLEHKTSIVYAMLAQNNNDWEVTFYQLLLSNFGFKVNQAPFERLGKIMPLSVLLRHRDNLFQLEALLFGTAGLLSNNFEDDYAVSLKKEYDFLRHKYGLSQMQAQEWRFMRMRPVNFPTIRLSQLAALIYKNGQLFSNIRYAKTSEEIIAYFRVEASDYWTNHYQFDKPSAGKPKKLGESAIHILLINAVVQTLFAFGKTHQDQQMQDKALMLLESLDAENNNLIRKFEQAGLKVSNALHSQALIYLHQSYCKPRRCLECRVGHVLLRDV